MCVCACVRVCRRAYVCLYLCEHVMYMIMHVRESGCVYAYVCVRVCMCACVYHACECGNIRAYVQACGREIPSDILEIMSVGDVSSISGSSSTVSFTTTWVLRAIGWTGNMHNN